MGPSPDGAVQRFTARTQVGTGYMRQTAHLIVEAGRSSLVEARESRIPCPGRVDFRSTTGIFGDLDLALWTPADRVPQRQPGDLRWAVPDIRPTASWLSGPVYRSVRRNRDEVAGF